MESVVGERSCKKTMTRGAIQLGLLGFAQVFGQAQSTANSSSSSDVRTAIELLRSQGIRLCHDQPEWHSLLPSCSPLSTQRSLDDSLEAAGAEESEGAWLTNLIGAIVCVGFAALAAGLTLGLLGLDPLLLLIKERAGRSEKERRMARNLLPLVQQHHRLLVTLLLMNSIANEALPIFLEGLLSPTVAVLVSVTLVLFFGEIIPSAIFTGPNQLQIANRLAPLVKAAMCVLGPIAIPIAKLLDWFLHDDDGESLSAYNRGELSALIRIQYEDRMASKRRRKAQQQTVMANPHHVGGLDLTGAIGVRDRLAIDDAVRATVRQLEHAEVLHEMSAPVQSGRPTYERSTSIHVDEVTMVEGALQMKTKVAVDVFTPLRKAFLLSDDTLLTEKEIVQIYASGYSRIPIYRKDPEDPTYKSNVIGVLITKQLIVVNSRDKRPLHTLPLYTPRCVSHDMSLVDLLNQFQTGGRALKGGHMALVCSRPDDGNTALGRGEALPKSAGLVGIITLEDVLEMLLQEQIYDEQDRYEKDAQKLAKIVVRRWKAYVQRRRAVLSSGSPSDPALLPVVQRAVAMERGLSNESTFLLH